MNKTVYNKFASVYDRMGADRFSVDMVRYTIKIMKRFGIEASDGLDLCCGTGTAILHLIKHGLTMSGLDQSPAMLRHARKKLSKYPVGLYRRTLPSFTIGEKRNPTRARRFDLVTCFFDSLNYMRNERQLKAAFRSVYRHLAPGGWFVFDMNTPEALKIIWGSQTWGGARNDLAWIWRNSFDRESGLAELATTFFVKSGHYWQRFDELHIEKGYSNRTVRRLLCDVGFEVKGLNKCLTFEKPTKKTYRICVVAKRPN
jgi:ubiquinone/menaquinone biosynthesis C-methylase UbiE